MNQRPELKRISILAPCYNEERNIQPFLDALLPVLNSLQADCEVLFVDDGSSDGTLQLIASAARQDARIKALSLSRNFGKEAALTAAIDYAEGDIVIPIDVDLQDPPELIPSMIEKWRDGADVVLARRSLRPPESLLKKWGTRFFYRLILFLSPVPIPQDVGDFRLMDRAVVESIRQFPERSRYMKGIMSWPGFNTEEIEFPRPGRTLGRSKWNLWKLFNHGLDGLFSFSTAPLRIWGYLGLIISFCSLTYLLFIISKTLVLGADMPGYASIVSIILFFSGINLLGLGILGEYLGRVFIEVKRRPVYLIKSRIGFD